MTLLRVCVDARHLPAAVVSGTGVYAVELLRHLPPAIEAAALVRGPAEREAFARLGLRALDCVDEQGSYHVLHRPAQIYDRESLELFLRSPAVPVITCLDLISYRSPALFPTYAAYRRYRGLLFASLQAAEAVIAISEHGRREILEEFLLAPERVHSVPLGVDASHFAARDAARNGAMLQKHGISGAYFLCAGTDFPHKNLPLLLRGYAWFRACWKRPGPPPALVLIGPPSGAPGGVFQLGPVPAEGVHYLGAVHRDDVAPLYQRALAFVFPSSYEGFGLPVLEAMAAGVPVLCARLTSVPEVAGDAALYLDELSMEELVVKMNALASDEALRARLVQAGHQRARMFPWEETARRTAEIYAAVAAAPVPEAALHRRMLSELFAYDRTSGPFRK